MIKHIDCTIPIPPEIVHLNTIFHNNGFNLYGVGGFVRDFLIAQEDGSKFHPKDVDLATDAQPSEIGRILDKAGIRNFEKGESFGVWVAHLNGQDFEIATLRTDGEYKDGRHPEKVEWTTPENDYKRRDLTINALYYLFPIEGKSGRIIDYGDGIGFEDIKSRRIQTVGDPYKRFDEDKLRVLRALRFHHRFNDDYIMNKVDPSLIQAIRHFRELRKHGISGPRIVMEFLACVKQARSLEKLLFDLNWLFLLEEIFPRLEVDCYCIDHFHQLNKLDPVVVIGWLLRNNNPKNVRNALNSLNYPGHIFENVEFFLETIPLLQEEVYSEDRNQKLTKIANKLNDYRRGLIEQSFILMSRSKKFDEMTSKHFVSYQPKSYNGEEVMARFSLSQGPEVGKHIFKLQLEDYVIDREQYEYKSRIIKGSIDTRTSG